MPAVLRLLLSNFWLGVGFGTACAAMLAIKRARGGRVDGLGRARLSQTSRGFASQRFLVCSNASFGEIRAALARFAARFSFRDLPDFLVIVCRGDLSDITALLIWGPVLVPVHRVYAPGPRQPSLPDARQLPAPPTAVLGRRFAPRTRYPGANRQAIHPKTTFVSVIAALLSRPRTV
jgi:hypothetical protein